MHIETIGIRDLAVDFPFGGIVVVEVITGFRFNQFTIYIVQYFLHDGLNVSLCTLCLLRVLRDPVLANSRSRRTRRTTTDTKNSGSIRGLLFQSEPSKVQRPCVTLFVFIQCLLSRKRDLELRIIWATVFCPWLLNRSAFSIAFFNSKIIL